MSEAKEKYLKTSVQYVKGIGEKRARVLHENDVQTVYDLLYYFPRRYLDRSHITRIAELREGDDVTVVGKVTFCGIKKGKRKRFVLVVGDGTGFLNCVWFQRADYWNKVFSKDEYIALSGKVGLFGDLQMVHPEYDRLVDDNDQNFVNTGRIIPLYPSGDALGKVGLDSRGFRRILRHVVAEYGGHVYDTMPAEILERNELIDLTTALHQVHFPDDKTALIAARKRLKFDELYYLELMLALRRKKVEVNEPGIEFLKVGDRTRDLIESLPFELTGAQKKVLREIRDDMRSRKPMNRLVQGDVGSGKTMVALISMLMAVENGFQSALMAPTEILAEQHHITISRFVRDLDIPVTLLVGGQKKAEREAALAGILSGETGIVVGTHALIQEGVAFHNLGLAIIDEQHRFGVVQRSNLMNKGTMPDVLVMTATPIPRTLSMTLYGDLDVSIIDELPPGRKPIKTHWRSDKKHDEVYRFVRDEVDAGAQVYIIFPLVEESEKVDLKAAIESYEDLKKSIFSDTEVGLLHGRMKSAEKEETMAGFKAGKIRVLVSTTVIEVGVDVPNATIMVIEHAERFGLPQLHQLRGRVGRGEKPSYCFLMATYPISNEARKRLNTMVETTDGFRIAEVDLQIRGPGEFFGTRQHGLPNLRIADIVRDTELLLKAREEAFALVKHKDKMKKYVPIQLRSHFFKNYREKFEFARVG